MASALRRVLGEVQQLSVGGRTDAGVHAEGQIVSFLTTSTIPVNGLVRALGGVLPEDVWAAEAQEQPLSFDARRSALRRWYRYLVWQGPAPAPEWRGRCLIHPGPLDLQAMRAAGREALGRRDAGALVGGWGRDGRPGRSTVRSLYVVDWLQRSERPLLVLEVCGDAFLRHMVRTLAGSLLAVGEGRWTPAEFAAALASADRRQAGPTAPAHGLTLWKIEYPRL